MEPVVITLHLVDGTSTGLRTGSIANWSGAAVAGPRSDPQGLLDRPELSKAGIYFLLGHDSLSNKPLVYIGESGNLRKRLKEHTKQEYWAQAIAFTDNVLTKDHCRYLEGEIIKLAKSAQRAKIKNSKPSGAHLSESEMARMNVFIGRLRQLLPILGTNILSPIGRAAQDGGGLVCRIKQLRATGARTETGFVVYKGSQAVLKNRHSARQGIRALRQRLIENGVLRKRDNHFVFARDEEFGSPSYAAAAVFGGNAPGPRVWKDSKGRSLHEIEKSSE